jgi:hypothetical protein
MYMLYMCVSRCDLGDVCVSTVDVHAVYVFLDVIWVMCICDVYVSRCDLGDRDGGGLRDPGRHSAALQDRGVGVHARPGGRRLLAPQPLYVPAQAGHRGDDGGRRRAAGGVARQLVPGRAARQSLYGAAQSQPHSRQPPHHTQGPVPGKA